MSTIDDGGHAFPLHIPTAQAGDASETILGMSMRDYLAVHASDGDVSVAFRDFPMHAPRPDGNSEIRAAARYHIADAMLRARKATAAPAAAAPKLDRMRAALLAMSTAAERVLLGGEKPEDVFDDSLIATVNKAISENP